MSRAVKLNNGASLPTVGLGTWQSKEGEVRNAIKAAIAAGYRHIDCASNYMNEHEIGDALAEIFAEGHVKRSDVFITSKLNNPYHRPEHVRPHLLKTLKDLKVQQLDLWLMHWPVAFKYIPLDMNKVGRAAYASDPDDSGNGANIDRGVSIRDTWTAMEKCVEEGLVKAIGVSNFTCALLHDLLTYAKVKPAVNQVESHPYCQQRALLAYQQRLGIAFEAYSPLGSGGFAGKNEPRLLDDPVLHKLAKKYHVDAAKIALRWAVQRGTVVLPKSVHEERIASNIDVYDFQIEDDDMRLIATLDKNHHYLRPNDWYGIPLFTP
ncbi:NADP-dependent oxidoreductase domain-containing protein [Plasmodiophora brassicae]